MPPVIATIGANIIATAGLAGTFIGASYALTLAVGATAIGYVTRTALRSSRLRDAGASAESVGSQVLVRSTSEPRKMVYGRAMVSGPLAFMNSAGQSNESLVSTIALVGHQSQAFVGFYLDDKYIPIADVDTGGNGAVNADTTGHGLNKISGTAVIYIRGHLGTSSQTVETMVSSLRPEWDSNHRGRGVTYVALRLDQFTGTEEVWQNGSAPSNISAVIDGKLVYDPRLDSTFTGAIFGSGSGSHRLNDPTTWEWSDNPALCLADYLTDEDLGFAWDSAVIDYDSVATAADACDELVPIPTATTEKRFTCNGVLVCSDNHRDNVEAILSSMGGTLRNFGGLWRISAAVWPGSDFSLSEPDIIGTISYRREPERGERYNAVRGMYFDPQRVYKASQYLQVDEPTLRADRDDDLVLVKELDLPMTNSEYMCQRLAYRALAQASLSGVCVIPLGYNGLNIAPGDVGEVTIGELGFDDKNFRCVGLSHIDMVGVEITVKEDDEAAYEDPAEGDYGTRSAAGVLTFPKPRNDITYPGGSLVSDPFFDRTTKLWDGSGFADGEHLKYFWLDSTLGAATATIAQSGGVVGGVLQCHFTGSTIFGTVSSIPRRGSTYVTGEWVRLNVRVRKTNTPVLTAGSVQVGIGGGDEDCVVDVFGAGTNINIPYTDINGWTVNQWHEYETTFQLPNVAKSSPQKPYVIASVEDGATKLDAATDLEFDAINVTRIATP